MQPGRGPNQIRHNFIIVIVASPRFFADINFRRHFYLTFFIVVVVWLYVAVSQKKENWEGQKSKIFFPFFGCASDCFRQYNPGISSFQYILSLLLF